MTFLPVLPSSNEHSERKLNLPPKPVFRYLSGSPFLANSTSPNKQYFKVKSKFKSHDHVLY